MSRRVMFKPYHQDQLSFLSTSYDDLVPKNHPVRVVNTIIDHIYIYALGKSYRAAALQATICVCYLSVCLCLLAQHLFFPKNRTGTTGECPLYVAQRSE
jgi:hypothetical protein